MSKSSPHDTKTRPTWSQKPQTRSATLKNSSGKTWILKPFWGQKYSAGGEARWWGGLRGWPVGGGVREGTVNYLQIFKEDICRYLKKISADSRNSAGICWKSICKGICREGYLQQQVKGPANPPKTLECPRAPCGSSLGPEQ